MEEWICTQTDDDSFTVGKVYRTDGLYGDLKDNRGRRRLNPEDYNLHYKFELYVATSLENE